MPSPGWWRRPASGGFKNLEILFIGEGKMEREILTGGSEQWCGSMTASQKGLGGIMDLFYSTCSEPSIFELT